MSDRSALDRFLRTDPLDAGCGETMERLDVYAELTLADARPERRYPGWERTCSSAVRARRTSRAC